MLMPVFVDHVNAELREEHNMRYLEFAREGRIDTYNVAPVSALVYYHIPVRHEVGL